MKENKVLRIANSQSIKEILRMNRMIKTNNVVIKNKFKKQKLKKNNVSNQISVLIISKKDLKIQSINHAKNVSKRNGIRLNPIHINQKRLERWEVNYIRHQLTKYDHLLAMGVEKESAEKGRKIIVEAVYKKIANVYPFLKDECERQLNEHMARYN